MARNMWAKRIEVLPPESRNIIRVQGQPVGERYRDRHSTESLGGNNNNNNRYRIACYSIELNASVDYMKPSFAIKSMNHCIFNRELDTG